MQATSADVERYEGLVLSHARRVVDRVDGDLDDVRQTYREKVWKALVAYDPRRSKVGVDRWVFSCLWNAERDALKRRRHRDVFLEDQPPTAEPCVEHEQVFGAVDEGMPLIPNTLTEVELHVVALLYDGYMQTEVARFLGLTRCQMEASMRSVREKFADWKVTPKAVSAESSTTRCPTRPARATGPSASPKVGTVIYT